MALFFGTPDPDTTNGEAGNDFITGGFGNDTLFGGLGDDGLYGGLDNDALVGGDGNDFLNGSEGDDILYGEGGRNFLIGGLGNDNFVITSSAPGSFSMITDFGVGGNDTVTIQQSRFGTATIDQFQFTSNSLFYDVSQTDAIAPLQVAYIIPNPIGTTFTVANNLTLS